MGEMRRRLALATCLIVALAAAAEAQTRRVLYLDWVGPGAHRHDSLPHARAVVAALGQSSGAFTVTATDDAAGITAATLASFDAIAFFTSGELPWNAAQREALLAFIASGKGFVGIHSASDSAYSWPEYGELIGGRFRNHSIVTAGSLRIEDATHVAMQGLSNPLTITDEFYEFTGPVAFTPFSRAGKRVLMNLDPASVPPFTVEPGKTDFPLAWTREHGAGRVFYTALGHSDGIWDDARFRGHVLAALRWALGDGDGDGLDDAWERTWGLRDNDGAGVNGAAGDPDGDGRSNAQEQAAGTHPRGFSHRYLAEGATSAFFATRIGVLNPSPTFTSRVQLRYQLDSGAVAVDQVTLAPRSRRTVLPPPESLFSTLLVSDQPVVADRLMTWSRAGRYGSHAESALAAPAPDWYFAEGATHGRFDLFYLVQNPSDQGAEVEARFLRGPTGAGPPVSRRYTVGAHQRLTINADFIPGLDAADIAAEFHSVNGTPIIVERAMYLSRPGELWTAGIDGTGVTTLATTWFLAEGATGTFFDTFVQVANPNPIAARLHVTFQRPFGAAPLERDYDVAALGRLTIPVEQVAPELAGTSVSIAVASTNGVPVVAERSMWWPGSDWYEGHATLATNTTGTAWAVADGETGGLDNTRTYLLVASGSSATIDSLRLVLVRDAGPPIERVLTDALLPNARLTIDLGWAFPDIAGERVGVILESMGEASTGPVPAMPIVVERAMYADGGGPFWSQGSNLVATRLR
jgi:type 1 glutamine amidotransferase